MKEPEALNCPHCHVINGEGMVASVFPSSDVQDQFLCFIQFKERLFFLPQCSRFWNRDACSGTVIFMTGIMILVNLWIVDEMAILKVMLKRLVKSAASCSVLSFNTGQGHISPHGF